MESLLVWSSIVLPSAAIGAGCGYFIRKPYGFILAGALPWLGFLAVLLYQEYCLPYRGGGASMWPIALLVGGTVAAATGGGSFLLSQKLFNRPPRREGDHGNVP